MVARSAARRSSSPGSGARRASSSTACSSHSRSRSAVSVAVAGLGEPVLEVAHPLPGRGRLGGVDPAIGVEQGAVAARVEQAAIVMLAVDLDQQRAELAQQAGRDRLIVDEGAAAAVGLGDAADDERLAGLAVEPVLGEQGQGGMIGRQLEGDADHRLRLAGADQPAVGPHAEREAERVEQDRFARPGLAGQHAEARPELEVERVDQDDVADREAGQHGPVSCHR